MPLSAGSVKDQAKPKRVNDQPESDEQVGDMPETLYGSEGWGWSPAECAQVKDSLRTIASTCPAADRICWKQIWSR
jgi:hypothetical protein